jgi:hypothetical protein
MQVRKPSTKRKVASSPRRRGSHPSEPPGEGGPDEAATLIAETTGNLAKLARRHHLDHLSYLLSLAQLEAEEHLRLRSRRKLS